jgi:hypothetical protein
MKKLLLAFCLPLAVVAQSLPDAPVPSRTNVWAVKQWSPVNSYPLLMFTQFTLVHVKCSWSNPAGVTDCWMLRQNTNAAEMSENPWLVYSSSEMWDIGLTNQAIIPYPQKPSPPVVVKVDVGGAVFFCQTNPPEPLHVFRLSPQNSNAEIVGIVAVDDSYDLQNWIESYPLVMGWTNQNLNISRQ